MEPQTPPSAYQPTPMSPPVQPPAPSMLPPVTPPASSMRAVWIMFGAVVLLGVGVFAWMQLAPAEPVAEESPSPSVSADPTADWKTYTNTQYGFEFRYPNTWLAFNQQDYALAVDTTKSQGANTCKTKEDVLSNYYLCVPRITFLFNTNSATSFEDLLAKPQYQNLKGMDGSPWTIKRLGKIESFDVAELPNSYLVYSSSAQKSIEIMMDINDKASLRILSTFRFIEPTSTVPADWKSFSSKYFTLSFKVPPGFVVTDGQNIINIYYGAPEETMMGGPPNLAASLVRYSSEFLRQGLVDAYRQCNTAARTISVAGIVFPAYEGKIYGEADCSDYSLNTLTVLFDASAFHVNGSLEGGMSLDLAKQVLSTFKFTK